MKSFVIAYNKPMVSEVQRAVIVADTEQEARLGFIAFCGVAPQNILYCFESSNTEELFKHTKCWKRFDRTA